MKDSNSNAVKLKDISHLVLKQKPKNKFDITYQRGMIKGEDKVIVELYLNNTILAQAIAEPADIIGHLETTLKVIKNPA